MRISDWSSDVCSSDLTLDRGRQSLARRRAGADEDEEDEEDTPRPSRLGFLKRLFHRPPRQIGAHRARIEPSLGGRAREDEDIALQIGSAWGMDRVCQYVSITGVAVSLKKTTEM